jgi:hypothetical protein
MMRTISRLCVLAFGLGSFGALGACAVGVDMVDPSLADGDGGADDDAASSTTKDAGHRDSGAHDAGVHDASTGFDAAGGPSAAACLDGWADYAGTCPAPTITSSYVGNGCVGTTGWFVLGTNFQLEQHNTGIADYGPQSFGANGDQKSWNVITTTELCVTVAASAASAWVGHTIYVKNPDGKSSNAVTVTSLL